MKYSLNRRDWLKGLLMATIVPALYIIQSSVSEGSMVFNWKQIAMASVGGFVGYLIKNYFTDDVKAAEKILADNKIKPAAPNDSELNK